MAWSNWYGNGTCTPHRILRPTTEDKPATELAALSARGGKARVVGAGHSTVPIAAADDTLFSPERMRASAPSTARHRPRPSGPGR